MQREWVHSSVSTQTKAHSLDCTVGLACTGYYCTRQYMNLKEVLLRLLLCSGARVATDVQDV